MALWEIKGRELANCTCEYGCNCQFDALPDKGHCHAVAGILIEEGHHGDTRLDGLRVALLRIMSGQDTDPFATMFAVFASTLAKFHDPVFTQIDFEVDVDARRGRLHIADYVEMVGEPIRNKITGQVTRAQIVLPDGFEYTVAEIGRARSRSTGPVQVAMTDTYGQFAALHLDSHGVVRP